MKDKGYLWRLLVAWWWGPLTAFCRDLFEYCRGLLDEITGKKKAQPRQTPAPAPTPDPAPTRRAPAPAPKTEHHNVAGTSFHREALLSFGVKNEDYTKPKRDLIEEGLAGERIYQTDFFASRVELVPEPDNPSDPNAIKVVVDGQHIGYIKKGSCAHVRTLLQNDLIRAMRCDIKGGPYKVLLEEVDEDGKARYDTLTDEIPLCADLFLTLKE